MRGRKGYGFIALLALLLFSAAGAYADGIVWAGNGLDNEGVASGNRLSAKAALDAGRRTVKRTADRLPSPLSSSVAKLDEKIVITEDGAVTPSSFPLSFSVSYDRTPNLRFDPEAAKGFSLVLAAPEKEGDSWVTKVLVAVEGSSRTESYRGEIVVAYPEEATYAATATRIPVNFDVTNGMTDGDGGASTPPSPDLPPTPDPAPTGPISQNPAEWTLSVGAADAEGLTPVSIETNLYLDAEPTAVRATGEGFTGEVTAELGMGHILSKARATGEVAAEVLSGGRGATAAYLVVFSGKVKSLDAAAITGVFYRVKGSDEENSASLPVGGVKISAMSKPPIGPEPGPGPAPENEGGGGGGGCDGFGTLGLLALAGAGAFVLRRRG